VLAVVTGRVYSCYCVGFAVCRFSTNCCCCLSDEQYNRMRVTVVDSLLVRFSVIICSIFLENCVVACCTTDQD